MQKLVVAASLVATANGFAPSATGITPRSAVRTAAVPAYMAVSDSSDATMEGQSLEAEFASVKAASQVALEMAPVAESMSKAKKKKNPVVRTWRAAKAVVGLRKDIEEAAQELVGDECEIDKPQVCEEDKRNMAQMIRKVLTLKIFGKASGTDDTDGDSMEAGWASRGKSSATKRSVEVWGFLIQCGLKVVKAGKTKGTDAEVSAAKTAAAEFIRDGLFRLGPTFVKFGQVISTRTDVVEKEYIEVLKDLQDKVPGFGGDRAIAIIENEFGKPINELFDSFEKVPIAAASLGQVHKATYQGKPVAVKVQRAGLKELFDTDLKNLKVLAKLLDKFDPKSDGADRSYADIYDESAKLLYEEIDYTLEGKNAQRFKQSFNDIGIDYIRVPNVYWEVTNPRVLTMEFIDAIKMSDLAAVEKAGLDKKKLSQQVADAFLAQILKTSYFHCDPHPGNLQCDAQGNLVYFDCGMMNELKPNVAAGFKEACFAVFGGGPFISQIQLDQAGKRLTAALEQMGVLAKSADRLAVEKLARFFIRSFKDVQLGKDVGNIKQTLGQDLQALTDQQVFRFPSTFTFIFRAFASVDGIGKGLNPTDFDIAKSAQPFIEGLSEDGAPESDFGKFLDRAGAATGLRAKDVGTALTQPKKVAYLEETVRAMEQGNLKIRVRSLENEQALARLALSQQITNKLLVGGLFLQLGLAGATRLPSLLWFAGAGAFGAQAMGAALSIKIFDKKNARYESKDFGDEEKETEKDDK